MPIISSIKEFFTKDTSTDIDQPLSIQEIEDHFSDKLSGEAIVDMIERKQQAKHESKKAIRKKFKVGETYILKSTYKANAGAKEFILVKFIYTIKELPVNLLIMKQIAGQKNGTCMLNKQECKMFHIKYEDGLQIWPMELNWRIKKNK